MALIKIEGIRIAGIASCVPKNIVNNRTEFQGFYDSESLNKAIATTGIEERRIADDKTCTSDLCYKAAEELINNMGISKTEINAVVFVSQTPDYKFPATACLLQDRLSLSKDTLAFDINLGCSGYVYGLFVVSSLLQNHDINKIFLLAGDTLSKTISPKDRTTNLLFGDAGSATIIEKAERADPSYFSLFTDGNGMRAIIQEAGGSRIPSSYDTLKILEFGDGSFRSLENTTLDGGEVFNFTVREVPRDIRGLLAFSGSKMEEISFFVFHQANKFMLDYLAKKIKISEDKFPISLRKFGNTSSASIPLTIVTELENKTNKSGKFLLSGFGVGLSWGSAITNLDSCYFNPLIEY